MPKFTNKPGPEPTSFFGDDDDYNDDNENDDNENDGRKNWN